MTLFHKLCSIINLPWMGRKKPERPEAAYEHTVNVMGLGFDLEPWQNVYMTYSSVAAEISRRMVVRGKEIERLRKAKKRFRHLAALQAKDATWLIRNQPVKTNPNSIYDHG